MKYWFVIDDRTTTRGQVFEKALPQGSTREQALDRADYIWCHMTAYEQKKCDAFYIGYAESDAEYDSIFPDYDTMTDIEYIKQ